MSDAEVEEMIGPEAREGLIRAGRCPKARPPMSAPDLVRAGKDFRDKAPLSAAQAAAIILDGVRAGAWRILVGEDAAMIDAAIRAKPEAAYDYAELFSG